MISVLISSALPLMMPIWLHNLSHGPNSGVGAIFQLDNQDGLSAAIESALRIPFSVYDRGGNEVGTGQVGGAPLDLERGVYNGLVRTQPPERFDDVVIQGGYQVVLEME